MPNDPQPLPLTSAVSNILTALSGKIPPPFVEATIAPDYYKRFPSAYQIEAAIKAEALRRKALVGKPPDVWYDECGYETVEPVLPDPPPTRDLRVETRCPPNGQWMVVVVTNQHDPDSYW